MKDKPEDKSLPDKTRTSQTLARGLTILNCFRENQSEMGIKDLAGQLALPQTVVARLVATLVQFGYLYQNPQTKKYLLGIAAFTLGLNAELALPLKHTASPFLERLAQASKETVSLNIVDPVTMDGVCIASIDSPAQIKLTTRVGSVRPLHRGASRKVLLAYMEGWQQDQYMTRLNLDAASQRLLRSEIAEIRERGYAVSEEELDEGAFAVAAPVLSKDGKLLAGIALAGPLFRKTPESLAKWILLVTQTAQEVARTASD